MLEEYCKIEGNDIVIRLPIDSLVNGVLNSEYADRCAQWDGHYQEDYWKVIDSKILAIDLLHSLTEESEDGSSILSYAFDEAFKNLMEYSFSDGIGTLDD
jgi:hypothetical protein